MEQKQIKLQQERDFGDVFNATFSFIGQEIKPLGTAILYFVMPVLLIATILGVFVGAHQQKIVQDMTGGYIGDMSDPFSIFTGGYFLSLFLVLILFIIGYTMLKCTLLGYMKLYKEKGKDGFGLKDIWEQIQRYFFPVIGAAVVVGLVTAVGTVFCIIPGIYLGVSLSLIYAILVFEDQGIGNAFSRSFELVKEKWWLTFGLVIVAGLMVYVVSIVLSIPALLMGIKPMLSNLKNLDEPMNLQYSTGMYLVNGITSFLSYLIYSVPGMILVFHYFSLLEAKEKPSLQDKIEQIGEDV